MNPLKPLDRLDEAVGRWCPLELAGWACVIGGGVVASLAAGTCLALQLLEGVL